MQHWTTKALSWVCWGLTRAAAVLAVIGGAPAAEAATICVNPGGTGGCFASVQSAVDAAAPGTIIDVAPGTYVENVVVSSLRTLTIQGSDAATTIIDGSAGASGEAALHVTAPRGTIGLFGLAFRNAPGDGLTVGGSRVLIADCVLADNDEHGIFIGSTAVTMVRTAINGNATGIGMFARKVDLDQVSITGNGVGVSGWGKKAVVKRSDVSGNGGTGIEILAGPLTVQDSTIDDNGVGVSKDSSTSGMGTPTAGVLRLERTSVRGNLSGGVYVGAYSRVAVVRSTIAGNGNVGISADRPRLLTTYASTIAGNAGVGIAYYAPTYSIGADPNIASTTVAGNSGIGILSALSLTSPRKLVLEGTILADNGQDCGGTIFATGTSLIEDPSGCTLMSAGDLTGVDPQLGALQDNGGPTETKALAPTSPVLGLVNVGKLCTTDQRGVERDRPCDVGAFELP